MRALRDRLWRSNLRFVSTLSRDSIQEHESLAVQLDRLFEKGGSSENVDSKVYAELIQMCAKLKNVEQGKRIHHHISNSGLGHHRYLANHLVSMYGKLGCLKEARLLLDELRNPNVVSWTAMIGAYAQHGHHTEVMNLFRRMRTSGPKPNKVTFLNALNGCASLENGREIHLCAVESGLEHDVSVANSVLHMFGRLEAVDEARKLFDRMPVKNLVSWNSMLGANLQNGLYEEVLRVFHRMEAEGAEPDRISIVAALNACSFTENLAEGYRIHQKAAGSPLESELILRTALINMYGKCGSLAEAQAVFNGTRGRDIICWNTLISAYAQHGHAQEALEVFGKILELKIANSCTFVSVLGACSSPEHLESGRSIHARIVEHGFEEEGVVRNALVSMYSRCGSLEDAERVFEKSSRESQDGGLWNVMIAAYARGNSSKALECFKEMHRQGARATNLTFVTALNACINLEDLLAGRMVHGAAVQHGYGNDLIVENAVLSMYWKCGSLEEAVKTFESMSRRNVISWTAIVAALAQFGQSHEALRHFRLMQLEGTKPNEMTLASAVDACAESTDVTQGKRIHQLVLETGMETDGVLLNSLISFYGRCNCLPEAHRIFNILKRPNVISWTALISAYAQQGHGQQAFKLFGNMQQEGILPNSVTFISIISACSHAGRAKEGPGYFVSMSTDYGLSRGTEHFSCLLDLCGRAGWLSEAESLLQRLPFESGALAWMTLLGHCRSYGDVERGKRAAEEVFKRRPGYAPACAVLSSMLKLPQPVVEDLE